MQKENYYQIFKDKILPNLNHLEEKRKQKCRNFIIYALSAILITYMSFLAIQTRESALIIAGLIFIILGFLALVSLIPYYFAYKKIYSAELKKEILPDLLKSFGEITLCSNEKTILEAEMSQSGLFQRSKNFTFDDKFKGSYKNVNFEIVETTSPFKGLVISFDSDRAVKNRTVIVSKRVLFQKNSDIFLFWLPIIVFIASIALVSGNITPVKIAEYLLFIGLYITFFSVIYFLGSPFNKEILNKISLEDIKFSKKFDIYSSDEVEARYLVNPAFMERLLNLKTSFKSKNIRAAFYNNKLIIALSSEIDFFEIGNLHTSLHDEKYLNKFYNELSSILDMVEYFKLNINRY